MKLLIEHVDTNLELHEETFGGQKRMFFEGIFMQSERLNKNNRIYSAPIMAREVQRYCREAVDQNRAWGTLGHGSTPQLDLDHVSHRITEMAQRGNDFVGRALICETVAGNTARALLEASDGQGLGVSSRGLGSLTETSRGKVVGEDFKLICIDLVSDPSAPDAWVKSSLSENADWVQDSAGNWVVRRERPTQTGYTLREHRHADRFAVRCLSIAVNQQLNLIAEDFNSSIDEVRALWPAAQRRAVNEGKTIGQALLILEDIVRERLSTRH